MRPKKVPKRRANPSFADIEAVIEDERLYELKDMLDEKLITDINMKCPITGVTLLTVACKTGCMYMVKLLLDRGVHINIYPRPGAPAFPNAGTALIAACDMGHLEVVKLLLLRGADPNTVSEVKGTALMEACFQGHLEIVRMLIQYGAKLNTSIDGHLGTALMAACYKPHLAVVELLLENGVDVNAVDADGCTPVMKAAEDGESALVKLLALYGADVTCENKAGETVYTYLKRDVKLTAFCDKYKDMNDQKLLA